MLACYNYNGRATILFGLGRGGYVNFIGGFCPKDFDDTHFDVFGLARSEMC